MREIKFRAKSLDGIWFVWSIYDKLDMTNLGIDWNTLGQFTGLLDKNGKEIYEGDIVVYSSTNFQGIVNYETTRQTRFYLEGKEENSELHSVSDIEIIGNIYKSSELLTPSHQVRW